MQVADVISISKGVRSEVRPLIQAIKTARSDANQKITSAISKDIKETTTYKVRREGKENKIRTGKWKCVCVGRYAVVIWKKRKYNMKHYLS